jgi:hypothetical protein
MNVTCLAYLDDRRRAREKKISEVDMKRGMIGQRENMNAEGRYFLDRLTKKTDLPNG